MPLIGGLFLRIGFDWSVGVICGCALGDCSGGFEVYRFWELLGISLVFGVRAFGILVTVWLVDRQLYRIFSYSIFISVKAPLPDRSTQNSLWPWFG